MLPQPHEKTNMKNLLTAVVLSAVVLLGFEFYMSRYAPEALVVDAEVVRNTEGFSAAEVPLAPAVAVKNKAVPIVATSKKIEFKTDLVRGSVDLKGGLPSDVILNKYTPHGAEIVAIEDGLTLLGAGDFLHGLSVNYSAGGLNVPNADTGWTLAEAGAMTKAQPMLLSYQNTTGQSFSRELYFDGYVLHVEDTVVNGAEVPVSLQQSTVISRMGTQKEKELSSWYNYFGPQGLVDFEAANYSYKKVTKRPYNETGAGGYWGFTEQFFTVMSLVEGKAERAFSAKDNQFFAAVTYPVSFVAAGGGANFDTAFYVGPKQISELERAGHSLDTIVDFGWFHFIAKPMFVALKFFHSYLGNWGFAIIALTMLLKLLTYPLAAKSYRSMGKMRLIQPEVKALQEKHSDGDKQAMATEMMALYKKNGVNPMSGCWPMFVQIPIFFAMYKMVLLTFELRGAEFVLWITDLSVADPWYVLPVIMGLSMWVQMRLSPQMGDPMQAKIMQFLPVIFTVLFLFFPSGLVLYWVTNNIISVAQQYYFMRAADK